MAQETIKHFPTIASIQGQADLVQELRDLRSNQYNLLDEIATLKAQQPRVPSTSDIIQAVSKGIAASGTTPLNVQNLTGILAQPQIPNVVQVSQLPTSGPTTQVGTLICQVQTGGQLALFRWNGTQWVQISPSTFSPWQAWVPTFSGSGGMTVTLTSLLVARFVIEGKKCSFLMQAQVTLGGAASALFFFTPPAVMASPSATGGLFMARIANPSAVGQVGFAAGSTGIQQISVTNSDTSVLFTLGSNGVLVSGFFEIA